MVVRLDAGEGGARRGGGDQSPVVRVLRKQEDTAILSEVIDEMYTVILKDSYTLTPNLNMKKWF